MRLERRLHLRRRHVLATGDDRLAAAADDGEAAATVEHAEVARVQEAVVVNRAGRHRRAPHEDLAAGVEGELHPVQRLAGRAACLARLLRRDLRARFGQPVSLGDRDAGVERASEHARGHRAAADQRDAQQRRTL
jgi:hypothetical protein